MPYKLIISIVCLLVFVSCKKEVIKQNVDKELIIEQELEVKNKIIENIFRIKILI